MKQTAVEWFAKQTLSAFITDEKFKEILEKAKAMDEKNLKDSFVAGAGVGEMFNNENRCYVSDADKYYQETFE